MMGAFGYGVYDNDNAMDFAGSLVDQLQATLTKGSSEEIRVVADLAFTEFGRTLSSGRTTIRELVIQGLRDIPDEWYEGWDDPDAIHHEVNHTIRKLIAIG